MNDMEWALFGIEYLRKARLASHEELNDTLNEVREYRAARGEAWFSSCKNIVQNLYHYSDEFVGDGRIPGEKFSSPEGFAQGVVEYKAMLESMRADLDKNEANYRAKEQVEGAPAFLRMVRGRVLYFLEAVDYVASMHPSTAAAPSALADELAILIRIAERFHESVLVLKKHPHGGKTFEVKDEWDSQYLFRSILAAYFRDIDRRSLVRRLQDLLHGASFS